MHKNSAETDTLIGVERVRFEDFTVAFDLGEHAGDTFRLYRAAFAGEPDIEGLSFWVARRDAGMSLEEMARFFVESPEFESLYERGRSEEALVRNLYENVLRRDADEAGLTFWQDVARNQGINADDMLILFTESDENRTKPGDLR